MRSLIVLFALISCVAAQAARGPPRLPKDLPPGFAAVLPPDTVKKLRAIHQSTKMTPEQQLEQIDEIMSALPDSVLDKLPKPPGFDRLPKKVRDELEKIHRNRSLNFRQRFEKMKKVFDALPPNLRPKPPPPGQRL
ncbi:hypothetical protein Aduo_018340 [Ancylostoma duodenale]